MGTPPPFVDKPLFIPPEAKPFIIRRNKPDVRNAPAVKSPRWDLPPQLHTTGKIGGRL
jgi:hypothetical protein